jgi:hypothetical protein
MICDQCGSSEWETPDPIRHPMILKVWGPEIRICRGCGAPRYPQELYDAERKFTAQ